jgi:hypothetical protein
VTLEDAGKDHVAHRRAGQYAFVARLLASRNVLSPAPRSCPAAASPCVGSAAFRAPERRPRTARIRVGRYKV